MPMQSWNRPGRDLLSRPGSWGECPRWTQTVGQQRALATIKLNCNRLLRRASGVSIQPGDGSSRHKTLARQL